MQALHICFRALLVLGVPLWRVGWWLARSLRKFNSQGSHNDLLPLLRIGALRVGGAGKTPLARELVKQYTAQGRRVALLCHDVRGAACNHCVLVENSLDWRKFGDEATLLAQQTGADVWITRHRWKAWQYLSQLNRYDQIICDDGLEDPRLDAAQTILLQWTEGEHWLDLLPYGNCRSLLRDHENAVVWKVGVHVQFRASPPQNSLGQTLSPGAPVDVICAIGDPRRFVSDLVNQGFEIQHTTFLKDHSARVEQIVTRRLHDSERAIVVTSKDAVKLAPRQRENPRLYVSEALTFLSSELEIC